NRGDLDPPNELAHEPFAVGVDVRDDVPHGRVHSKPGRCRRTEAQGEATMRVMLVRTLQLAVPSLAMAVVWFSLFVPGAVRSFDGAQVWGGPTEGTRRLSWRVLGV